MRLFTAIDLSPEVAARVGALVARLRPLAQIGWSPAANLHITTKFIGQWQEARLPELRQALANLQSRAPIPISVGGLGFYPDPKSPRVFWAGVKAPAQLPDLARETDEALSKLGVAPELRAYSPHLTLARLKQFGSLTAFHKEVERLGEPDFGSFAADRFFLYLSKPGASGSVYTKLSEFPFTTQ